MGRLEYDEIIQKYPSYERICECFFELARTKEDEEILRQILKTGSYNSFSTNTQLSNYSSKIENELSRRLSFAEVFLFNRELFEYMIENDINVFHGTDINSLPNILNYGLMSHKSMIDKKISLSSGEALLQIESLKTIYPDMDETQYAYRHFISLTDDFSVAKNYSIGNSDTSKIYIMICLSGKALKEKYRDSVVYVRSQMTEIGVTSDISPEDIGCIITTPENVEYVSQMVGTTNIPIFAYSKSQTFKLNRNKDNIGFYETWNFELDDDLFEKYKDKIISQLARCDSELSNEDGTNLDGGELSNEEAIENIKWKIVFDLIEEFNKTGTLCLTDAYELAVNYKLNSASALKLADEINSLLSNYASSKKRSASEDKEDSFKLL